MAIITKDYVKRLIGAGTLNPKILNDFFHDIKLKSYDYDYLIQDQLIDLYTSNNSFYECYKRNARIKDSIEDGRISRVCVLQLDKDIIQASKRKLYKISKFYNKPQNIETMVSQKDVFKYIPICFINGTFIYNYRVQAREDKTIIYFPFEKYATKIQKDDEVSTVFLPGSILYYSRNLTDADRPDFFTVNANVFRNIDYERVDDCKGYISFITSKTTGQSIYHGTVKYDPYKKTFRYKRQLPRDLRNFIITIIGIDSYNESIDISPMIEYFKLPEKKMPIPKKNILVMVRNADGFSYRPNADDVTLTEYYPNIYHIDNPRKLYCKLLVLYDEKIQNEELVYDNEIEYYLSKVDLLDRYEHNNVPDILREYKPVKWDYLISNFKESSGLDIPATQEWFSFLYKLNKISSIYKLWSLFFQVYLRRTYGFMDGWYLQLDANQLNLKERYNTLPELNQNSGYYKDFEQPQYLFTYRNDWANGIHTPYSWFVDGKFIVPTYSVNHEGYQYVYFNKDLFKLNSVLDVERYDGNVFAHLVKVGTDKTLFKINEIDKPILANSLFVTDENGNFINDIGSKYEITITDNSLGENIYYEINLDTSVFILTKDTRIYVKPKSAEYANKTIVFNCNNKSTSFNIYLHDFDASQTINLNRNAYIKRTKKNILNRLRIYNKQGRLYPKYLYTQNENENVADLVDIGILVGPDADEMFRVEYCGYEEKQIYYQKTIPINGYIDLEGKIDKPFSLVYHDIFLSGFKLNKSQIEIISPFKIAIKNVETVDDLIIYEKIKGDELFEFKDGEESQYIADKLMNIDKEYFDKVMDSLTDIVINPDIIDMDSTYDPTYILIKDFIMKNFINADERYTDPIFDRLASIFVEENGNRYLFNADERVIYEIPQKNWFLIDHDTNIIKNNK